MLRKRLTIRPQLLVTAFAMAIAAALSCDIAAAADWYPHELPTAYRARRYNAGVTKTATACIAALERDGYRIVVADTLAGIIYTAGKAVSPESQEIGGEWQITCYIEILALQEASLVTAELLAESRGVNSSAPIAFDLQRSRRLYEDIF